MNQEEFDSLEWESEEELGPSKSQLKREMHELQELGIAIATLSKERVKALDLPDKLLEAIATWKKITAHGGKRRQYQYIGKLMRSVDPEPIRKALEEQHRGSAEQTMQLHHLEDVRKALLEEGDAGQAALTEWADAHSGADMQQLRSLIRAARKDMAVSPEKRSGRAFRELFQFLKQHEE